MKRWGRWEEKDKKELETKEKNQTEKSGHRARETKGKKNSREKIDEGEKDAERLSRICRIRFWAFSPYFIGLPITLFQALTFLYQSILSPNLTKRHTPVNKIATNNHWGKNDRKPWDAVTKKYIHIFHNFTVGGTYLSSKEIIQSLPSPSYWN